MTRTILLVTNAPTPYRLPLFNEVARQLNGIGFSLKVLFSASSYARREWKVDWDSVMFDYEVLGGRVFHVGSHEYYFFVYPGLLKRIWREKPAAVIVSGYSPATLLLRLGQPWLKTPFLIWSGEVRRQSMWRQLFRRWLVQGASAFIAYGSAARRYLESIGADPKRISIAINTVDTEFFGRCYYNRTLRRPQTGRQILLSVGALAKGKRLDSLLYVAKRLSERRTDFAIKLIGTGPELANLESLAKALGIDSQMIFAGYLQRSEIAEALSEASVFLFPSVYDIWGLALVEALAAGVPCISSIHAGATTDLIEDGRNGYAVDFADTAAVCMRIEELLDNVELRRRMGTVAHELVEGKASLALSAQGFVCAIRNVSLAE